MIMISNFTMFSLPTNTYCFS